MKKKSYVQVSGPASPQIRRVIQKMSPMDTKDINKVQVEPTGDPGQMGYVTNKPEEQGVIHIPEQNIKKQLQKAQPSVDPLKLKEQEEALVEDVIIPHEKSHAEDVTKGEGQFSPDTEQKAQKEEDWTRMQDEYGLSGQGRFAYVIELLDNISSSLEGKGMIKEATDLDIIANSIEKRSAEENISKEDLETLRNIASRIPENSLISAVQNIYKSSEADKIQDANRKLIQGIKSISSVKDVSSDIQKNSSGESIFRIRAELNNGNIISVIKKAGDPYELLLMDSNYNGIALGKDSPYFKDGRTPETAENIKDVFKIVTITTTKNGVL